MVLRTAPAWFLVERGLLMDPDWLPDMEEQGLALVGQALAPAWLLNSHLDVEELELVLVALFLWAVLDQELVEGNPW